MFSDFCCNKDLFIRREGFKQNKPMTSLNNPVILPVRLTALPTHNFELVHMRVSHH